MSTVVMTAGRALLLLFSCLYGGGGGARHKGNGCGIFPRVTLYPVIEYSKGDADWIMPVMVLSAASGVGAVSAGLT